MYREALMPSHSSVHCSAENQTSRHLSAAHQLPHVSRLTECLSLSPRVCFPNAMQARTVWCGNFGGVGDDSEQIIVRSTGTRL